MSLQVAHVVKGAASVVVGLSLEVIEHIYEMNVEIFSVHRCGMLEVGKVVYGSFNGRRSDC